jgi:uncharacterized protein YecT (DUF1311 family)
MRALMFLAITFALALSQTASSQALNFAGTAPDRDDRSRLESCVDLVQQSETEMSFCVGIAVASCEQGFSGNTFDLVSCYSRELGFWDEMLNINYRALRSDLNTQMKDNLRSIQLDWIKHRDDSCLFQYQLTDGTIAQIFHAACQNRATAYRAISLYNMVDYAHGDRAESVRRQAAR